MIETQQPEEGDKTDPQFIVMPQEGKNYTPPPTAPMRPPMPGDSAADQPGSIPKPHASGNKTWVYIVAIVVVLIALGAGAYYMLGTKKDTTPPTDQSPFTKQWLQQYFNTGTCSDQTVCGEQADPDNDGMTNLAEFQKGTNPLSADSDNDGLADGDEINIFKTEISNPFTDTRPEVSANNWTDGFQLKGGYDPIDPGKKLSEVRIQQIKDDIVKFKLHEPSITTLKGTQFDADSSTTSSIDTSNWKSYSNAKYGFEFKYPSDWYLLTDTSITAGFVTENFYVTNKNVKAIQDLRNPGTENATQYTIDVSINLNPNKLSVADFMKQPAFSDLTVIKTYKVNGVEAIKTSQPTAYGTQIDLTFARGTDIIDGGYNDSKENHDVYESITNTLRLL